MMRILVHSLLLPMAVLTAQALTNVLLIVILIRLFTMGRGW